MEIKIEQVLYRDQRTIKTRFFNSRLQKSCPFCQINNSKQPHESPPSEHDDSFLPYSLLYNNSHHHQGHAMTMNMGIQGGVSPSSLDINNNCHNQYFSKFKRLPYRTEASCKCENVSFVGDSDRRRKGVTPWLKKLQTFLLLSTYLSVLTLPPSLYAHALPAKTMCNRNDKLAEFWKEPCSYMPSEPSEEPPSAMKTSYLQSLNYSLISAIKEAKNLKDIYRNQTIATRGSDPEEQYKDALPYEWLPKIPKYSSEAELQEHLKSLQWKKIFVDLFEYIQMISVPVEQLTMDFSRDDNGSLKTNFSVIEGLILNVLCELGDVITVNNLRVRMDVTSDIMPLQLRQYCDNKTDRATRDWIIMRELVSILEYTLAVCAHFNRSDN